ncbi:MAG: hypothetical protein ACFFCW_21610, partial [Candidatus Hodarchaeota archaeon]
TQADIAQREGISRISITRTMSLLRLAPQIQDYLLSLTNYDQLYFFTEKKLRPITQTEDHEAQLEKFEELKRRVLIRE